MAVVWIVLLVLGQRNWFKVLLLPYVPVAPAIKVYVTHIIAEYLAHHNVILEDFPFEVVFGSIFASNTDLIKGSDSVLCIGESALSGSQVIQRSNQSVL